MPFQKMSCWINDSAQQVRPWENAKMKLIVYIDSALCTECTLRKLYMWKDFINMEQEYDDDFYIFFIFQPSSKASESALVSKFRLAEINHPMYVDKNGELLKENPHIPSESMCHTFLLNREGNVVLVGEPLFRARIEKRLRDIVTKELKNR